MPRYRPCPECGTQPITRRGMTITTKHTWAATCTNGVNCDLYPYTGGHATPADALAAWEAGKAFPDETPSAP